MAPKRRIFCNYLGKNRSKAVMERDTKQFSDPKTVTFEAWGLKTSLGQFEPKAFGKGLIKPLIKNPSSSFHKQNPIFSRIMR